MRKLRSWYRHPDRELLRREVAWTLRWFARPPGLLWAILFFLGHAVAWVVCIGAIAMIPWMPGLSGPPMPPTGLIVGTFASPAIDVATDLLCFAVWGSLVHRRTLAPFEPSRRRDFLLTPLSPKEFWPGLLAGPATFSIVMAAIKLAARIAFVASVLAWGAYHVAAQVSQPPPAAALPPDAPQAWWMSAIELAWLAPVLLGWILKPLARLCFVVWRSVPDRPAQHTILARGALCWALWAAPAGLVFVAGEIAGGLLGLTTAGAGLFGLTYFLFGLIGDLVAASILLISWRGLIHPKTWEKIRACGEMPGV